MSFTGEFDRIDRAGLNPLPKRRIPIYGGGGSDAAYARAAKLGDGFIFSGPFDKSILPGWQKLRDGLRQNGRAVEGFGADYLLPPGIDVQTALDIIRRWRDAGGTHVAVRTLGHGFKTAQQHIDYLTEVRQRFR